MSKETVFLEQISISNLLSLRDVSLPLKQLTVLVGPNASGKSNVLRALALLRTMTFSEELPPADYIQDRLWAGGAHSIGFQLQAKVNGTPAAYKLELETKPESQVAIEELTTGKVKVIAIQNGRGQVTDENDTQVTFFRPPTPKLALKSAGDYGDKPITSALTEFIRGWRFYNFKPEEMRRGTIVAQVFKDVQETLSLDNVGSILGAMLLDWHENDTERFQSVNEALETCTRLERGLLNNDEDGLGLMESYEKLIPLRWASDGVFRLMAYQVLLNQPEIPSLIAIEEPERNLHPAALKDIASAIERLSERTQVIITTHSSHLLDAFNPDNLLDSLGVLLLQNIPGRGTAVTNIKDARRDRKALEGWITDFGIGSAIFESELLQDPTEEQPCIV